MHFTLERFKYFKYVAWLIFIGFAFFVGTIAMELREVTAVVDAKNSVLESEISKNTNRIDELEARLDRVAQ